MPGPVLTITTTVQCAHLGKATPVTPNPRVSAGGQPVVVLTTAYTVAGCTFPAMTNGSGPPCVTAQFTTAATRVQAGGQPLLLADSQGISTPNGTPLLVIPSQVRVSAQ
jgi:hypothetical protein